MTQHVFNKKPPRPNESRPGSSASHVAFGLAAEPQLASTRTGHLRRRRQSFITEDGSGARIRPVLLGFHCDVRFSPGSRPNDHQLLALPPAHGWPRDISDVHEPDANGPDRAAFRVFAGAVRAASVVCARKAWCGRRALNYQLDRARSRSPPVCCGCATNIFNFWGT